MEIKDTLGIGKVLPIDKLLDVLSNSFGRIFKAHFYKRDSDSKAYEIKKMAEAKAYGIKKIAEAEA